MGNKKKIGSRSHVYKRKSLQQRINPCNGSPVRPSKENVDLGLTPEASASKPRPITPPSSNRKFKVSSHLDYYKLWAGEEMEYDIVDIKQVFGEISEIAVCKNCLHGLSIEKSYVEGLAMQMKVFCSNCESQRNILNCVKVEKTVNEKTVTYYDLNLRLVHGLRQIGKGYTAGRTFLGCMNLPPPPTKYLKHGSLLLSKVEEVTRESMKNAAKEAISLNGGPDLTVAVDGTWQKRGHTSLNGVLSVTSADTSKVLDVTVMSKFCLCKNKEVNNHETSCAANYLGTSGGMEVHGALEIFRRSEELNGARYVNFLGDGDSKAFDSVKEAKVYGDDVDFRKLECVGHVQKRMGKRLMTLKCNSAKVKLDDGKGLGGKGRLSQSNIQRLQTYYGLAIRRNVQSVEAMSQAIWAVYYHTMSSDEEPMHHLCPRDKDTWCKYNLSVLTKQNYTHSEHFHIPKVVMTYIKPTFKDLSDPKLLERCLKGKTQNQNESLNNVIWSIIPKRTFVTLPTLKYGVFSAVSSFNDGLSSKIRVVEALGLRPGKHFVNAMKRIDILRIKEAEKKVQEIEKKIRNSRALKRKQLEELFEANEDPDNPSYCAAHY